MKNLSDTGAVILAAGRSRRMGRIKALLEMPCAIRVPPETFLDRAIQTILSSGIKKICVVTNPKHGLEITKHIPKDVVHRSNPSPETGMAGSIRIGRDAFPKIQRLLVMLVDVPLVSSKTIELMLLRENPRDALLLLPRYEDGRGHPVLLYSPGLEKLDTELPFGLKSIIRSHPEQIHEIDIPGKGPRDIDTEEDYRAFLKSHKR